MAAFIAEPCAGCKCLEKKIKEIEDRLKVIESEVLTGNTSKIKTGVKDHAEGIGQEDIHIDKQENMKQKMTERDGQSDRGDSQKFNTHKAEGSKERKGDDDENIKAQDGEGSKSQADKSGSEGSTELVQEKEPVLKYQDDESGSEGSTELVQEKEPVLNYLDLNQCSPDIINEVSPDIIDLMKDYFHGDEMDRIMSKESDREKISTMLDFIDKRCTDKYVEPLEALQKMIAGLYPELYTKMLNRSPTVDERNFCIQPFRGCLIEKIKGQMEHGTDTRVDLPQNLDENFVQLQVVQGYEHMDLQDRDSNMLSDYQAFLEREPISKHINPKDILDSLEKWQGKIVVVGRAGIGKTTTVQWLSRQWSLGNWAQNIILCFVIQLRRLFARSDRNLSLVDVFTKETIYGQVESRLPAEWLENSQGEEMLVVLDGLDEIADIFNDLHSLNSTNAISKIATKTSAKLLIQNLMKGFLLPKCILLCTSRPFLDLPEHTKGSAMFEILGLTENGVKEYVQKKYTANSREIQSVLIHNPVLLSACSITFYCTQVARFLNEDRNLSTQEVETYTRLECYILKLFTSRKEQTREEVIDDKYYFPNLAKLAYNGIFESESSENLAKMVFDMDDIVKAGLNKKDVESARQKGILTCTGDSYEFIHLSVQELLSVVHFLTSQKISSEKRQEILDQLSTEGSLNMILLYLFGIFFDTFDKDIMKFFPSTAKITDHRVIQQQLLAFLDKLVKFTEDYYEYQTVLQLCQIAHETQSRDIAKHVVGTVCLKGSIDLSNGTMTALDMKALLFTCKWSSMLETIGLKSLGIDNASASLLAAFLEENSTVKYLDLSGNRITAPGLTKLGQMLAQNKTLQILRLDRNQIKDEDTKGLIKGLRKNEGLKELFLSGNLMGDDTAVALAECITETDSLERIDLRENLICNHGSRILQERAIETKQQVNLEGNLGERLNNSSVTELMGLVSISFNDADLNDQNIQNLVIRLKGAEEVQRLSLCCNPDLTMKSVHMLRALAFTCPNLKSIDLGGNEKNIPERYANEFLHLPLTNIHDLRVMVTNNQYRSQEDTVLNVSEFSNLVEELKMTKLKVCFEEMPSDPREIQPFLHALERNGNLEQLHLQCGRIQFAPDPLSLTTVFSAVEKLTSLTCLGLSDMMLSADDVGNLSECLSKIKTSLRVLQLHINPRYNKQGLTLLGEDFFHHTNLETLDIANSHFPLSKEDLTAITDALRANGTLKYLRVAYCKINDPEAQILGQALGANTELETLSVAGNPLTDIGIIYICRGLLHNSTVKLAHLDLSGTRQIGEKGMRVLGQVIKSLKSIDMGNCYFNENGRYFKDALRRASYLDYINLQSYGDAIHQAMEKNNIKRMSSDMTKSFLFPKSPECFHDVITLY